MQFEGTSAYVAEARAAASGQGGARHRQDRTRRAGRQCAGAAELIEWHIKSTTKAHQGLYEYDAVSRLRDSQLGDERVMTWPTTSSAASSGRPSRRRQDGAADRRDRQGRYRVSQRPAAGTRPDGVLRLRDRADRDGAHPAHRHHHLEQREGTAGRVPAPLFLPLHPLSRHGDDEADRRGAFPRHQADTAPDHGADAVLRDPRPAGAEEEALDLRGAGLAQAAPGRGLAPGGPAPRRGERAAETARCASEERAGRPSF
jgi:hypothetical protein